MLDEFITSFSNISKKLSQTKMNLLQYFNNPEVRKVLDVNEKLKEVSPDSLTVYDNYQRSFESSNWIYDILAKYGYRMLHITGNVDGVIT